MSAKGSSQKLVALVAEGVLLAASLLNAWYITRIPQQPSAGWLDNASVSQFIFIGEGALGVVLVAGLFRRSGWLFATLLFAIFAAVTAIEAANGKDSCGCFGAVRVKPVYTMWLDLAALTALIVTGKEQRQKWIEGDEWIEGDVALRG